MQKQIIHKTFVFDKNVPQLEYEKYINPEDLLDEDFENVKGEFVNYRKKTGVEILKEEQEQRKKNEQRRMTQTPADVQPKKKIYDEQDDTKQMLAAISQKIKEEENNCKQLKKQVLLPNFGTDFTLYKHMIQKTDMAKQIIFSEADFQLLIKKEQDDEIRVQKQQVVRKKKGFVERQAQDKGVFDKKMYKTWYKPEDTKQFRTTAATSIFKRTTSNMTKEYFFNKALEILDRYMDQLAEIEKSQDKYGLCPQDFIEYRVDSLSEAKLFKFYNICEKFALSPYHLIEHRIKSLKKAKQEGLVVIEKESHRSIDQRIETLKKVLQILPDILKNMPIAEQKQDHQFKGLKQTNMSSYLQQVVTKPIMDEKLQLFKTPKVHGKRLIEMTTKAKHMKVQKFDFKRYVLNA